MFRRLLCIVLPVLALSLPPAGCSTEAGDGGGSSSSASARKQLIGTWVIDPEMAKDQPEFKNASEEEQAGMLAMLNMMKMEITFTDKTCRMVMDIMGEKQDDERPYTVASESGNTLVLETEGDEGGKDQIEVTVEGDMLSFSDEGQSFALRRK